MTIIMKCLLIISIFLQIRNMECQNLPPTDLVKITYFNNTEGLYYKFLDKVKVTNSDWKLINYLDLSDYTTKYLTLFNLYNETFQLCSELRKKINNPESTYSCQQFAQATIPHLHEIDQNHQSILSTIGSNDRIKNRNRRGLSNAVSRLANVLFGSVDNIDFISIFNKITQLAKSRLDNIDVIPEQTRIVKTMINETNHTLNQILTYQQKLEQNIQSLGEQAKLNSQNIDQLKIRTMLLEQTLFFEVLLNQYAYETQNLLAIVDSALQGKVHSSILHTQRWLTELREIKAIIPVGTTLPLEISAESIPDFIKISEITIVHKDKYLIFVVKIPLAQTIDFNANNVIPLPITYDSQNLVLIESNMEVLAISYDTEKFFSMTNKQWEMCKELQSYTLCRNSQPTHHKSKTDLCEVMLLSKP
uniref:Envelope fusion protein n=1 Tax=Sipha flava TaxID=143950 RepID=A0A2S2QVD2_9HEMI